VYCSAPSRRTQTNTSLTSTANFFIEAEAGISARASWTTSQVRATRTASTGSAKHRPILSNSITMSVSFADAVWAWASFQHATA